MKGMLTWVMKRKKGPTSGMVIICDKNGVRNGILLARS